MYLLPHHLEHSFPLPVSSSQPTSTWIGRPSVTSSTFANFNNSNQFTTASLPPSLFGNTIPTPHPPSPLSHQFVVNKESMAASSQEAQGQLPELQAEGKQNANAPRSFYSRLRRMPGWGNPHMSMSTGHRQQHSIHSTSATFAMLDSVSLT